MTLGWRRCVSTGLISAPKTMHALPWGCSFPGHLFAVSLARHQLVDGAPRANVDRGWHPPYSSLASPLESKYHLQNHPTASPTLVGMLTGICCPHGVSLRQVHGSMGTCFYVFVSFMHSSCCVSLYATNLGGAQISLITVILTSEHENASLLAHF